MLTDIFADRYAGVPLWQSFTEVDQRFLVQSFRILSEQVCPYYVDGNEDANGKTFWTTLNSLLSMELGLSSLSKTHVGYTTPTTGQSRAFALPMVKICENWMLSTDGISERPDRFMKERVSLVELGFRKRRENLMALKSKEEQEIKTAEVLAKITKPPAMRVPGDIGEGIRRRNDRLAADFQRYVDELNARFRQAGYALNYHNGFVQISDDDLTEHQIEKPFWMAVADVKWKNVDTDIKEALDRRDTNQRDPAFYAARALESAIKVISDENGWTDGTERGAANYIDKLAAKRNGFLSPWEAETLKKFFTAVRNPLGHGPGAAEMPTLTLQQTDWAIETCMSWIRSMIQRL